MTEEQLKQDPSTRVIVSRMRELRRKRLWTAEKLAEEMTDAGFPWEAGVVTKLETGRRKSLSVTEWLTLAFVLNVSPLDLLVQPEGHEVELDDSAVGLHRWAIEKFPAAVQDVDGDGPQALQELAQLRRDVAFIAEHVGLDLSGSGR